MSSTSTGWIKPSEESHSLDLVLRLTSLELLLRPMGFWGVRAFILVLAALGLLIPKALRAPILWLALSILIGWRIVDDWPLADNHIYLLGYWCLALFLCLKTDDAQRYLAISSKLLIGLAFAFAVLWKAFLSPEYLDGRFFRVTFMLDERFAHTTMLFGGLTADELNENRAYLQPLPGGAELLNPPALTETPSFLRLVKLTTWCALLIEAAIAVLFLSPLRFSPPFFRHMLLLSFCIITYAFAPVAGFGWLLLVMGLSQCAKEQKIWRWMYVTVYFLVLLYSEIPWAQLLYQIQNASVG